MGETKCRKDRRNEGEFEGLTAIFGRNRLRDRGLVEEDEDGEDEEEVGDRLTDGAVPSRRLALKREMLLEGSALSLPGCAATLANPLTL